MPKRKNLDKIEVVNLQVLNEYNDLNYSFSHFVSCHLKHSSLEQILCPHCNKILLDDKISQKILDNKVKFLKLTEIFDKKKQLLNLD